jgi:transcriptional antiterminator NusG
MMRADVKRLSEREVRAHETARQKAELVAWLRNESASRNGPMAWYVARTRWRADAVAGELRANGIESLCPMERVWRRYPRSTKRYAVENPLLGNYLFVHLLKAESAWVGVLTFEGIQCLQGSGERPVALSESDMLAIRQMVGNAGEIQRTAPRSLAIGDDVIHPVGMFAELAGTIVEIDASKREALISTMLFGREVSTRCGIDDLQKLS